MCGQNRQGKLEKCKAIIRTSRKFKSKASNEENLIFVYAGLVEAAGDVIEALL
jgi:hypothetical protein